MSEPSKCWSLVKSSGACPTARSGHSAVVAKESLYIFGGFGHPAVRCVGRSADGTWTTQDVELEREVTPVLLGDLHVYDLARQTWSQIAPTGQSVVPGERTCAAMCASEEEDRLFLSGGAIDDNNHLRADLLEFDVRRRIWRLLFDGSESSLYDACRRMGHAMVHDSARNRLVVFGGSTGYEYFDDTQAFDLSTRRWYALSTSGERPTPRYKHQAFMDSDCMYVVGGGSYEPEGPDLDVFRLNLGGPKALVWERMRPTGKPPCCRAAHGLAWDKTGRTAYIWGGFTSCLHLDSTFCALRLPPAPDSQDGLYAEEHQRVLLQEHAPPSTAFSETVGSPPHNPVTTSHNHAPTLACLPVSGGRSSGRPQQATMAEAIGERPGSWGVVPSARRLHDVHSVHHPGGGLHPHRSRNQRAADVSGMVGVGSGGNRNHGRGRWRRKGQRLWGQSGDSSETGRRRRYRGGSRRRSWGQGWASGRFQGLWRGAGQITRPSPPPTPQQLLGGRTLLRDSAGRDGERIPLYSSNQASLQLPGESGTLVKKSGQELAWISLPSRSELGNTGATSSPAGRSFHCAFFHSGACYVTGGSDGLRKLGDMWRFVARETPPPLTTLAARAVVSAAAHEANNADDEPYRNTQSALEAKLPKGLPEELFAALANLNMQAEVVV